ncbi:hypothetical protein BAC1_00226 [uncultured bacterium]|nr:hypothetical protein BAC1_00226 [uncultured bacterium]
MRKTSSTPHFRSLIVFAFLLTLLLPALSFSEGRKASGREKPHEVKDIKTLSRKDRTRVFIDVAGKPEYKLKSQMDKNLLHIEMENSSLSPAVQKLSAVDDGRIKTIQALEYGKSRVRISVEMETGFDTAVSYDDRETFIITVDVKSAPEKAAVIEKQDEPKGLGNLGIGGYLKNETAYRLAGQNGLTKVRNIFFLSSSGELFTDTSFAASGRLVYDAVFDLTDNYPASVEDDQEFEADLRDFYIDHSRGDWDLRAGKQQIVWGEAVGLFFADAVNAKDLREFVLPDFDYIRIPQWAADVEYSKDAFHLELIWIPVLEFNKLGEAGSEFPAAVPLPSGVGAASNAVREPSNSLENSEAGLRASYLVDGWDLSIFHLYTWDKFPANERAVTTPFLYTFSPEHRRLNITGFTFAKEISDVIFKGEFIYNSGKYFSVLDASDSDGLVRKNYLDYLIGLDYTFLGNVDFNFQFMQRVIFDYDPRIFREDEVRTSASVWLKTGLRDNTIEPEILIISSLRERDMLIRPKVTFKFRQRWQAKIGLDVFEGVSDGLFGQYADRDRVYAEARYDF